MKAVLEIKQSLLGLVLAVAFSPTGATASPFPIATNPAAIELGWGVASEGSNLLVGLVAGTNISVQLISPAGALLGSPVTIGQNPSLPPPTVGIACGQTNYLLGWSDASVTSGVTMFGQLLSQGGVKAGSPFRLLQSQGTHGFQALSRLVSDGTNFLVTWQDNIDNSLYGQLVTAGGALAGAEFLISGQQVGGNNNAVAFGKTNYLVVWQSGPGLHAYGCLVSLQGTVGSPFQISQSESASYNPQAVGFDGTNYLVVWNRDIGPGWPASTVWDLYGRRVSSSGNLLDNELPLVTDSGSQVLPALAFDGANYLLAWGDGSFDTNNATIRFRFFDASARPVGPAFTVFTAQGTNVPLAASVIYAGAQFNIVAMLGEIHRDGNGDFAGFGSGDVYGAFLPASTAPPRLEIGGRPVGDAIPLRLSGTPGINYTIEVKASLAIKDWTALVTNSCANGTFTFTDVQATNARRFYRAAQN